MKNLFINIVILIALVAVILFCMKQCQEKPLENVANISIDSARTLKQLTSVLIMENDSIWEASEARRRKDSITNKALEIKIARLTKQVKENRQPVELVIEQDTLLAKLVVSYDSVIHEQAVYIDTLKAQNHYKDSVAKVFKASADSIQVTQAATILQQDIAIDDLQHDVANGDTALKKAKKWGWAKTVSGYVLGFFSGRGTKQ